MAFMLFSLYQQEKRNKQINEQTKKSMQQKNILLINLETFTEKKILNVCGPNLF